ncbi:uracil-xanthine permease family protein [Alkalibacter mobilis]|uniref:uracil-xanthine permease family protein n=1 Tax=Alkalibacter mobilis TaxID=2787712 RepID=UPI00189D555F|nr:uracil-xanthine permease family protein [Alkalibacter mobilis]MBF7097840.1 uracil-xanthine permease [Alkalibacter mobilis]
MNTLTGGKKAILGFQHLLAMFGATVLVPILTGMDTSVALLSAGLGTLIFHLVTGRKVPVFLGSSFAFIGALAMTLSQYGIGAVKGGVIGAGLVYIIMAIIIQLAGAEKVRSFFPPIVTGPVIIVIGLRLSPVALSMAGYSFDGATSMGHVDAESIIVASVVILTMVAISIFAKGFFKLVPILISVIVGYVTAALMGMVDTTGIMDAAWLGMAGVSWETVTTLPEFNISAITAIAPIAMVIFIEHFGDITTNGAVVGKDFFKDPGVHRTMLGDGLATVIAGFLGGPANTTYSENTGVLAVTKVYDPSVLRLAAIFAVILSMIGKFGALINSIPTAVMGGVSIILFGMIASVGVRTMVEAQLDFAHSRNLIISSLILVTGIAIDNIFVWGTLSLSGLAIAAFLGIVLNKLLPSDI